MKITHAPILLIENDPTDALLVQRAFRKAEFDIRVKIVPSGEAAIEYLRGDGEYGDRVAHPLPVMLVVDLKMPPPAGIEVIEWVRAQPGIKRLPVVVLSSSRDSHDVDRAYDAGASSYLVKPVAFDALQMMLTTFGHYWLNFNTPPFLGAKPEGHQFHAR
jgi:CheY-like chemotaxis protein